MSCGLPRPRSRTLLLGVATMALPGALLAQVSGYNFTRVAGTYTEITGGTLLGGEAEPYSSVYASGTSTATSSSNYYWQVQGPGYPVGFNFPFNGSTFDRIGVSGAGYVALGNAVNGATAVIVSAHTSDFYGPLSHPYTAGQASVIPPADRLNRIVGLAPTSGLQGAGAGQGSTIRIETIGSAPNRVCVIQWKNYRRVDFNGSTSERINFQIRLNESGVVEVQFKDPTAGWLGGLTTTQMGLRGAGATVAPTDFQTMMTPYDSGMGFFDWAQVAAGPSLTSSRVQLGGTAGNKPADGAIFRWTAPTCPAPSNVKLVTAGAHSLTISYNYSGGTETYDYAVNTVNSPTTGTPITGGGTNGGTLTATGLASNTQYYAFIRKNCGGGDLSGWVQVGSISTTIAPNTMVPNAIVTSADCGENWNKSFEFVGGAGPIDGTWSICAQ
ncbi:MAG TPA: hypothetical protein VHL57_05305, partial [Flavobacteriales bacterium]|nr:hypothetical protein [Flavobacteriales bacterium]